MGENYSFHQAQVNVRSSYLMTIYLCDYLYDWFMEEQSLKQA